MEKSADAFRTISEVAEDLGLPQHVLRFWETRFPQIRPLKRAGGRRYYRPADIVLLRTIRRLLYDEGYTIKGVQRLLKEQGAKGLRDAVPVSVDLAAADLDAVSPLDDVETGGPIDDAQTDGSYDAEPVALATPAPAPEDIRLPSKDRDVLREMLAVIEECERLLGALHRTRG